MREGKSRVTWRDIVGAMRETVGPTRVPERAEFWSEFRMRAALMPQTQPVAAGLRFSVLRWAALAAAASVLLAAGIFYVHLNVPRRTELSRVISVQVVAPHSALLIMSDEDVQSTLVWVVDLAENSTTGEAL